MLKRISVFLKKKEILKNLVVKNLKAKYAGSMLGTLWIFINPLLLSLIIAFIFTQILKVNVKNFYLFVLSGMLPWSFFASSVQEASTSITNNANLLKQFSLPREFIPVSSVVSNFVIFFLGYSIVVIISTVVIKGTILFLPLLLLVMLLHLVFTLGIALFVSAAYIYLRDIGQLLNTLLLFWLWLTPVFYSIDMMPVKYKVLFNLNPITPYINLYRCAIFDPSAFNLKFIYYVLLSSAISFLTGYAVFIRQEPYFLKRI